jgi:hypothetical protein
MGIKSLGLSMLSMLAFAALAPAQGQISVGSMTAGQPTAVTYSNPDRAGESILVKVDNGEGEVEVIEIQLDKNGKGSEDWDVPANWMGANFGTDDAHESFMIDVGATSYL